MWMWQQVKRFYSDWCLYQALPTVTCNICPRQIVSFSRVGVTIFLTEPGLNKYISSFSLPPSWDRENLQKLPQLAAIHHNNCMYIAHHLLTLGHQFRYRLTNILCDGAATFVDLVPGFRRLGNFASQYLNVSMDDMVINPGISCWTI